MATGQFIAYYRVSTQKQGRSGLGLDAQRDQVLKYLEGGKWERVAEYTEVESGSRRKLKKRPELHKALEHCRRTKAKLVVAKLDRLARDAEFINRLLNSDVKFVSVDLPECNTETSSGRMFVQIMAVLAEWERNLISERTKAAMREAKARGVQLGGPNIAEAREQGIREWKAESQQFAENVAPIIREIQASGVDSLRGIARALNARGIKTRRDREWTPVQVKAVLARAAS
jgi:DNA invertase Pin-like site-specific DNA recombinase